MPRDKAAEDITLLGKKNVNYHYDYCPEILETNFDKKLVASTVALCHSIGIKCCIEGVEQEAEYDLLTKECHADTIQGYLFGHPESIENFELKFLEPLKTVKQ